MGSVRRHGQREILMPLDVRYRGAVHSLPAARPARRAMPDPRAHLDGHGAPPLVGHEAPRLPAEHTVKVDAPPLVQLRTGSGT